MEVDGGKNTNCEMGKMGALFVCENVCRVGDGQSAQEGEEMARFPPHMDSPTFRWTSSGSEINGGRRRQSRRREGRMDGGEQTLEKHQADEYEQIRITRARARLCPEARSGNFCFFFLLEMSLTLNYWLLM